MYQTTTPTIIDDSDPGARSSPGVKRQASSDDGVLHANFHTAHTHTNLYGEQTPHSASCAYHVGARSVTLTLITLADFAT